MKNALISWWILRAFIMWNKCDLIIIHDGKVKFRILISVLTALWQTNLSVCKVPVYLEHGTSLYLPDTKVAKLRCWPSGKQGVFCTVFCWSTWAHSVCIPGWIKGSATMTELHLELQQPCAQLTSWICEALSIYHVQNPCKESCCLPAACSVSKMH